MRKRKSKQLLLPCAGLAVRKLACVPDGAPRPASPAMLTAQIGAAIGASFSHALLAAVIQESEPVLSGSLIALFKPDCCFGREFPPHATYFSSMRLVRDWPMERCLREPRRRFTLASPKRSRADLRKLPKPAEVLARHYAEAG